MTSPHSRAVRYADARPEQAHVVVDLGDRADRRARVAVGRLLVDADRRAEALDEVDVGSVDLTEELACVRAERFDVPALALGEDRVERETGLSGAAQTREDDERITRNVEVDVLQIVDAGTPDTEFSTGVSGRGDRDDGHWSIVGAPSDTGRGVRRAHLVIGRTTDAAEREPRGIRQCHPLLDVSFTVVRTPRRRRRRGRPCTCVLPGARCRQLEGHAAILESPRAAGSRRGRSRPRRSRPRHAP